MWQADPSLLQMALLGMSGGLIGVLFMIPLRRYLIQREHGKLPYPEGTACAEVLVASEAGGGRARAVFYGLGLGALVKVLTGWLKIIPAKFQVALPLLPKAELGAKVNSALFGVGYILGPRVASIMVGGGLLSSLVIIPIIAAWGSGRAEPFYPEPSLTIDQMSAYDIWNRYVRYIGAGAVATAGIITLIKSIPTMIESFRIGAREMRSGGGGADVPRTRRDLPMSVVLVGVGIVAVLLAVVPAAFREIDSFAVRAVAAVLVVVFAFFFVTVSSRIVGLVGVTSNPTSGMTIAALLGTSLLFLASGWTDTSGKIAALCVGCVVAIAASIAGDTSQDLKTGFLLGATPKRQQLGELIGVLTSATFVGLSVMLLAESYGFGGKDGLAAPQATMMKLVIEGVLDQSLPWSLVGIGVVLALVVFALRIPVLPFAVGVYLPVSTMVPVFLGGMLRWFIESRSRSAETAADERERGILLGSGLVGGEGLIGVLIAGVAFTTGSAPKGIGAGWAGSMQPLVAALALGALGFVFATFCRRRA